MYARIDAFEEQVQKRLVEARSSDLSTIQSEIEKLRADMTSSLVALVTLLEMISPAPYFELFTSEEPTQTSHRKKLLIESVELEESNVHPKPLEDEEEDLELALRTSRHEKEMTVVHEHDRGRDIGPTEQSITVEETTLQQGDSQTQPQIGA